MCVCLYALTCFDALERRRDREREKNRSFTRSFDQCRFHADMKKEKGEEREREKEETLCSFLNSAKRSINRSTVAYLILTELSFFFLPLRSNWISRNQFLDLSLGTTFFCSSQGFSCLYWHTSSKWLCKEMNCLLHLEKFQNDIFWSKLTEIIASSMLTACFFNVYVQLEKQIDMSND